MPTAERDAFMNALERALRSFGAKDIAVTFRDGAPNGRAGLTIAFYPSEFAYKVGNHWDGEFDPDEEGGEDG